MLQPKRCICPNEGYTCQVELATEISWITTATTETELLYTPSGLGRSRNVSDFRVNFTHNQATEFLFNFTSTLLVTDFNANGTNITCVNIRSGKITDDDTTMICIVGMFIHMCKYMYMVVHSIMSLSLK